MKIPPIAPIRRAIFSPIPTQRRQPMENNTEKTTTLIEATVALDKPPRRPETQKLIDDMSKSLTRFKYQMLAVFTVYFIIQLAAAYIEYTQ